MTTEQRIGPVPALGPASLREYAEVADVVRSVMAGVADRTPEAEARMVVEDLVEDCGTFAAAFRALADVEDEAHAEAARTREGHWLEVEDLHQQLATLRADAERLDWMIANHVTLKRMRDEGWYYAVIVDDNHVAHADHGDLRAAIDAARLHIPGSAA